MLKDLIFIIIETCEFNFGHILKDISIYILHKLYNTCVNKKCLLFSIINSVADIDDTEVIWIALLRHAGKNTGST